VGDFRSGDELAAAFARWSAEERVRESAGRRSGQRRMAEAAAAGATWAGVLLDLAESGEPVALTVGGRRLAGHLSAVGEDFCVVENLDAGACIVALGAISSVRQDPSGMAERRGGPSGDRPPALRLSFASALGALVAERLPVAIWSGDELFEGDIAALGGDVVTIRNPGPGRRVAHLRLGAVTICQLR